MRMANSILVGVFILVTTGLAATALSGENSGAEKALLETLRENGAITREQYETLKAAYEEEESEKKGIRLNAVWDKGLGFESPDGAFDIAVGGRILHDWAAIDAGGEAERAYADPTLQGTGTNMRQARLYIAGTVYERFTFSNEFEFLDGDADIVEVWIGMTGLPVLGEARVGHQKEAFSLERMNSLKYTVFIERGLPVALTPGRNSGIKFHNAVYGDRLAWGIGFYKSTSDSDGFDDSSDYNISARITGLPFASADRSRLLHVGLSYSHQFMSGNDPLRYRSEPEVAVPGVYTLSTGDIAGVDAVDLFDPEIALVWGPFCLQGEYVRAITDAATAGDPEFYGYYAFGSWFLTGEHRVYKLGEAGGEFARVSPRRNFSPSSGGWGAWEVGLRYSYLDLNDEGIRGGKGRDWTAGLNWYLNPNLRGSLNYIRAKVKDRNSETIVLDDSDADILVARFQIDF